MKHLTIRTKRLPKRAQSILDQLESWIEDLLAKDI